MASSPNINELVTVVLKSPRGIIAIVAVIGSLLTFVYLFLLRRTSGSSSSSRRSPSKRTNKQATDKSLANGLSKKSPVKRGDQASSGRVKSAANATPSSSSKTKETRKSKKDSNEASSDINNNKSSKQHQVAKQSAKKDTRKTSTKSSSDANNNNSNAKRANSSGKPATKLVASQVDSKAQKDDGEWITVAKKKPRASARQAKS